MFTNVKITLYFALALVIVAVSGWALYKYDKAQVAVVQVEQNKIQFRKQEIVDAETIRYHEALVKIDSLSRELRNKRVVQYVIPGNADTKAIRDYAQGIDLLYQSCEAEYGDMAEEAARAAAAAHTLNDSVDKLNR